MLMRKFAFIFMLLNLLSLTTQTFAEHHDASKVEEFLEMDLSQLMSVELGDLNPMGVHHTHDKGEFMVAYSSSFMKMGGNRDGSSGVHSSEVLRDFMVAPTEMTMTMQMFGIMYAPTDKTTIMTMIPYTNKSMKHINRMGVKFKTRSEGPGDLKTSVLYSIHKTEQHLAYISGGLSFPTGSISKRDTTPTGRGRLLYPMQLGSGTFDLLPAIAYMGRNEKWNWGAHLGGVIRSGENQHDYRLGDEYKGTVWLTREFSDQLSTHVRLDSMIWDDIRGADSALNPAMVPTADPHRRGGKRTDIGFGVNLLGTEGAAENHRLSVEFRIPVYQWLRGPQLETDWTLSVGWQKIF